MRALSFELVGRDGKCRVGRAVTLHGEFDTPAFMPVGTQGTVKGLMPDQLAATGTDGRQISLGPFLGPQSEISPHNYGQSRTEKGHGDKGQKQQKTLEIPRFPRDFQGCDNGMSKVEPTGVEPVTSRMPF